MIIFPLAITIIFYTVTRVARFVADFAPEDPDAFGLGDLVRVIGPDVDGDTCFILGKGIIEAGAEDAGIVYVIGRRWATNVPVENIMLVERA